MFYWVLLFSTLALVPFFGADCSHLLLAPSLLKLADGAKQAGAVVLQ